MTGQIKHLCCFFSNWMPRVQTTERKFGQAKRWQAACGVQSNEENVDLGVQWDIMGGGSWTLWIRWVRLFIPISLEQAQMAGHRNPHSGTTKPVYIRVPTHFSCKGLTRPWHRHLAKRGHPISKSCKQFFFWDGSLYAAQKTRRKIQLK